MHSKIVRKENDPVLSRSSLIGGGGNLPTRDNDRVRLSRKGATRCPLPHCHAEPEVAGVVVVLANDSSRFVSLNLEPAPQNSASPDGGHLEKSNPPRFRVDDERQARGSGIRCLAMPASMRTKAVAAPHQYDLDNTSLIPAELLRYLPDHDARVSAEGAPGTQKVFQIVVPTALDEATTGAAFVQFIRHCSRAGRLYGLQG
jgi:hypothetical protein